MTTTTRSVVLPGVPASVSAARRFVSGVLGDVRCPAVTTAELIVSELVTNAVQHSRSGWDGGKVRVVLVLTPGQWVRLGVRDDGPADGRVPVMPTTPPPPGAEDGRGLWLVATLADACGYSTGHAWARLAWDREALPACLPDEPLALFALPGGDQ